jgi:hypothetical protein
MLYIGTTWYDSWYAGEHVMEMQNTDDDTWRLRYYH